MTNKGFIHSFESMGTLDGPGVRMVVFFQGCNMRCMYCHNPDSWEVNCGTLMTEQEILNEFLKKKSYYANGGVTFSGGEVLLQLDFLIRCVKLFKENNIHITIDTSGSCYHSKFKDKYLELIKYIDLVLMDIKLIDPIKHKKLTSRDNQNILEFCLFLDKNAIKTWIRYVLVPSLTDEKQDLIAFANFVKKLNYVEKIQILPYHSMAKFKYQKLNIDYVLKDTLDATSSDVLRAQGIINNVL